MPGARHTRGKSSTQAGSRAGNSDTSCWSLPARTLETVGTGYGELSLGKSAGQGAAPLLCVPAHDPARVDAASDGRRDPPTLEVPLLKGLRALAVDHPRVGRRVVVSLEPTSRQTEDGILVLGAEDFCARLSGGDLF